VGKSGGAWGLGTGEKRAEAGRTFARGTLTKRRFFGVPRGWEKGKVSGWGHRKVYSLERVDKGRGVLRNNKEA